jgi:FADH2 O2-dependent halogenase
VKVRVGDQEVEMPAKVVVDASGRNTLLGRQLRLKKKDPLFNQYAIHAWFDGVDRGDHSSAEHIHIYFLPVERGWVWQIPITDTITSIGVVVEREVFSQARLGLEQFFYDQVQTNDNLAEAMCHATRVNEFKTEGDYSYSMSKFVGDGYLLVGDAARFVDPIFSSGVSIALYSAKFAAERIVEAFKVDDFSEEVFAPYEAKLRSGVEIWYEFIRLYYKLLPLFTYFINSKKYRLEVLRLLQGDVFDRSEVDVLDAMRRFIDTVENSEEHMFKGKLTDIPIESLPELV